MSQIEPTHVPTTGGTQAICPNCGMIVNRGQRIIKGILQGIGFFLLVPLVALLLTLIMGPDAVQQNSTFLAIAWVALGFPPAGKAISDGFKRSCPVCGSDTLVSLSSPEGQRLKTERPWGSVLKGHTGKVTALAVLNDGRLASAAGDHTVCVWDVAGNADPVVLTGHQGTVTALVVLADGRLASGSKDKTVRVWDVTGATEPVVLTGHTVEVFALAALADGRVASAGNGQLRVCDPSRPGDAGMTYEHWNLSPEALAVLPDGRIIAGGWEGIQIADPSQAGQPTQHSSESVKALAVLPDGRLVCGGKELTLRIFQRDVAGPPEIFKGGSGGQDGNIQALAVLPDGRVASYERPTKGADLVRLWDLTRKTQPVVLLASAPALAALPDGRLATSGNEKTIHLRDVPAAGPTA